MKAVVADAPGPPHVLRLTEIPRPTPSPGCALLKIKAFGLNRAELFTRQGHSPGVAFPRVLGIECVGVVESAPGCDSITPGQTVAAIMGGMGRQFDGSYAEYVAVPESSVFLLDAPPPAPTRDYWATLGAIPEMFQTVWGSLTVGLEAKAGETLLIRGGSSSIGMTTTCLAKRMGLTVYSTTRNPQKCDKLLSNGADHVLIDDGSPLRAKLRALLPAGADKVLELVGTSTLLDSLGCARLGGVVCMTGILGSQWTMEAFTPMEDIPTGVRLTSYSGGAGDLDPG
eukprot:CAMPEP_0184725170 /NCGR_PEP_ID=MMETSP0314-20130426/30125_1 /TAXON_ID=38298 /ORGANISM="Rhodella maculata, Strain CCMP 736" /LENGTH=283 /DNA_ID=CAMNT_0027190333 /DNA_START=1 /DNA_END=848 /DNA_ORIENTATION=+